MLRDAAFVPHEYLTHAFSGENATAAESWLIEVRDVSAQGRLRRVRLCARHRHVAVAGAPPSPPPIPPPHNTPWRWIVWTRPADRCVRMLLALDVANLEDTMAPPSSACHLRQARSRVVVWYIFYSTNIQKIKDSRKDNFIQGMEKTTIHVVRVCKE